MIPSGWVVDTSPGVTIADEYYERHVDMVQMPSGRLVAMWGRTTDHYGQADAMCSWSDDQGQTWSTPWVADPDPNFGGTAGLATLGTRIASLSTSASPRRAWVSISEDDGLTWVRHPVTITVGTGSQFPSDLMWHDDGTPDGLMLVSVYGGDGIRLHASTDAGQTWSHYGAPVPTVPAWQDANETSMVHTGGTNMVMLIRSDTHETISVTHSTDMGVTWTPRTVVATDTSGLPRMTIMPDGVILATLRDRGNTPWLSSWVAGWSLDNGVTWDTAPMFPAYDDGLMMYGRFVVLQSGEVVLVGSSQYRNVPGQPWFDVDRCRAWIRAVSSLDDIVALPTAHDNPLRVELEVVGLPPTTDRVVVFDNLTGHRITSTGVSGTAALVTDYTAPAGEAVYRVQAMIGDVVATETVVTVATPEPPRSHVWLSDPLDETSPMLVPLLIDGDRERPRHANVATTRTVSGRVISSIGPRHLGLWQIVVHATTPEMIRRIQAFFDAASSVLIRGGSEMFLPGRMWGAIPDASESLRLYAPEADGRWVIDIQPDSGPGIDAVISTWTWGALEVFADARDLTWGTLEDEFPTWLDLERGPVGGGD